MEKYTCKLCSRSFTNGRALGGHMRSHVTTTDFSPPPPNLQKTQEESESEIKESSSPSSSASSDQEEKEGKAQAQFYGLRENPKKSFLMVDPEFSFAIDAGSVVVQDRESETESSKLHNNNIRRWRRSKRKRRSVDSLSCYNKTTEPDPEPVSSVSDTTPEEDVAFSLMMLSRDIWMKDCTKPFHEFQVEEEENEEDQVVEQEEEQQQQLKFCARGRNKYQCGTCKKVFRSYQALGGHRASHKKMRTCDPIPSRFFDRNAAASASAAAGGGGNHHIGAESDGRIHECPVCFRVFKSGQALGGHKRSHVPPSFAAFSPSPAAAYNMIDLNLPAPVEDDDLDYFSQALELSAVSN